MAQQTKKRAVIIGGLGVVGRNLLEHLERATDWDIIGLSRRAPDFETRAQFISVDLLDREGAGKALADVGDITHIYFAGFVPAPTWAEHDAPNVALLANAVDGLVDRNRACLEHVCLIQGTKYYGAHLGPFKTPAREDDPPHLLPNFYHAQQQWLMGAHAREAELGADWQWSAVRPHIVCGFSLNSPMNIVLLMAVYAVISRELGLPLRFPGPKAAYEALTMASDAKLLADAMHWVSDTPSAGNQAFNLTNGDNFRWCHVWPKLAEYFDMPLGEPQALSLGDFMPAHADLWRQIQEREGLEPYAFEQLVHWPFGDTVFHRTWDTVSDSSKIRKAGFHRWLDSEQMFIDLLDEFKSRNVIPKT